MTAKERSARFTGLPFQRCLPLLHEFKPLILLKTSEEISIHHRWASAPCRSSLVRPAAVIFPGTSLRSE